MWPNADLFEADEILLSDYFHSPKQSMVYIYDFGDDWKHKIVLEKITDEKVLYPICISGKSACPFEDCGGIGGYYHILNVIEDKEHPEYEDYRDWLGMEEGDVWDEHYFNLDDVNEILRDVG